MLYDVNTATHDALENLDHQRASIEERKDAIKKKDEDMQKAMWVQNHSLCSWRIPSTFSFCNCIQFENGLDARIVWKQYPMKKKIIELGAVAMAIVEKKNHNIRFNSK